MTLHKNQKKHFNEVLNYYNNRLPFTGNIQNDYYTKINSLLPKLDKLYYLDIGLWNKPDTLKFYRQHNANYVSQSLIEGMFSYEYDIVNVDSVKNIMDSLGHKHIDLFKLDIEGAEINVLENMFNENIFPNYLCVEFDLLLKNKDPCGLTYNLINKIIQEYNYRILINDELNITFERKLA